jgi:putative aldouronate transport system substrate-binding protein
VPNGKVGLAQLKGPKGIRTIGYTGNNGFYIFPKSSVKDEAELKRVLTFFDKLLDKKMADLTQHGIEGVDYKIVDGKAQMIDQDHFNKTVKMFTNGLPVDQTGGNRTPPLQRPLEEAASKMYNDNQPYLVKDASTGLFSQTYADKGADLDQEIQDANVKFITGNIDENAWKAAVEKWKKDGGDKVMAEFTAAYAKIAKK